MLITTGAIIFVALCTIGVVLINSPSPEAKASEAVEKYEEACLNDFSNPRSVRHILLLDSAPKTLLGLAQADPTYNQDRANTFLGITEQEVVRRLGQPYKIKIQTNAFGEGTTYRMLLYDDSNEKATLFVIFDTDGVLGVFGKKVVVSIGCYRGVWFGPGKEFFQSLH